MGATAGKPQDVHYSLRHRLERDVCLRQKNATPFSRGLYFNLEVKSGHHTGWGCRLVPKGQAQFGCSHWELRGLTLAPRHNGISISLPQKVSVQEKCIPKYPLHGDSEISKKLRNRKQQKVTYSSKSLSDKEKSAKYPLHGIYQNRTEHCVQIKDIFSYILTWN